MGKNKFAVMLLNLDIKIFVMHILAIKIEIKILLNLQIKILIPANYLDYTNIFLLKFTAEIFEYSNNNYTIKWIKNKQLYYSLIYNLEPIKLEILKAYIETILTNNSIQSSKSFISALILFNQNKNSGFYLWVNYQSFNKVTISN